MAENLNFAQRWLLGAFGLDPKKITDEAQRKRDELLKSYGVSPELNQALADDLRDRLSRGMAGQVADFRQAAGAQLGYQQGANANTLQLEQGRAGVQGQLVRNNTEAIGERTRFATDRDLANIGAGADATIRVMDPVRANEQTTLDKFGAMYDKTLAAQAADREALNQIANRENILNMIKGIGAIGLGLLA